MKIGFDSQIFGIQPYGGISRYFFHLAEQFSNTGHDVVIYAPIHINNYLKSLPPNIVRGRRIKKYPLKTKRFFHYVNSILTSRQLRSAGLDIIHKTYYPLESKKSSELPTIVTIHDMIHELYPDMYPQDDMTSELKKKSVDNADHVICVSENTRKDLINLFGTQENKISVVYHGVIKNSFSNEDQRIDPLSSGRPYLLYVGDRLREYKNFHGLIKSYSSSSLLQSDFDLVVFGGGGFSPKEKQYIIDCGLNVNKVHHIEGNDEVLARVYSNASVFIYPSFYEGFGFPPLEAMTFNCPVVSSHTSCMSEIIGNAAVYFEPSDIDDMRSAIEKVVYTDSLSKDLIGKGQQRLIDFSWQNCAQNTLEIYNKVLEL